HIRSPVLVEILFGIATAATRCDGKPWDARAGGGPLALEGRGTDRPRTIRGREGDWLSGNALAEAGQIRLARCSRGCAGRAGRRRATGGWGDAAVGGGGRRAALPWTAGVCRRSRAWSRRGARRSGPDARPAADARSRTSSRRRVVPARWAGR